MSLPEWLFDDESGECPECGRYVGHDGRLCDECKAELADQDADDKISEGKRR